VRERAAIFGSGAAPAWWADVLWVVGNRCEGIVGQMPDGARWLLATVLENVSSGGECRSSMERVKISQLPLYFFFILFFHSIFAGVTESGAPVSSSRGRVFENGGLLQPCFRGRFGSLSCTAGLNISVSQDGPRCQSTRTALLFFFRPRMVENVGLRGDVCALHQYAPRGRRVLCVIRIYSRLWGLLLPAAAVNNNNVLARMLASSLWQLRRRGSDISGS
jgi:hypothetical protein